jgi:hypothetical protein
MEEATFNMIDLPVELGKLRIENVIPKAMNSSKSSRDQAPCIS